MSLVMRLLSIFSIVLLCLWPAGTASAAKPKPLVVAFVGPRTGPLAPWASEYLEGVRQSSDAWSGSPALEGRPISIVEFDDGDDPTLYKKLSLKLKKVKPIAIVGVTSGRCMSELVKMARKRKTPLLMPTIWEPTYTLSPKDVLVHVSEGNVQLAIESAQYVMRPFKAKKMAILHDESAPSLHFAQAMSRNIPRLIHNAGLHEVPAELAGCRDLLQRLAAKDLVESVFLCCDAARAHRLAVAAQSLQDKAPRLLFGDGLATQENLKAAPASARFIEGTIPQFESGSIKRFRKVRAKKKLPASPNAERGFCTHELLVAGLRRNKLETKQLTSQIRREPYKLYRDAPLFSEWGQARNFEYFLYEVKDGVARRSEPLYLWAHTGGVLLRYRDPKTFQNQPHNIAVVLTWGNEKQQTIVQDLKRLGLNSSGYEGAMDEWVKDELLARCLMWLNRMYWRNADGTEIPGVSFDITFGLNVPHGAKMHKVWIVTIAGDDKEAGGRAFPPNRAFTYSTFLERTMYRKHALKPKLSHTDLQYFNGRYVWGTKLEQNLRHDTIRSLIDGYAGAMALTTAHECGHLGGLGHDQVTPRSLMNVVDAVGLQPGAAEWIPDHVNTLEKLLKRVPPPGKRRKR